MAKQTKKAKSWDASDYVRTLLSFILGTAVIVLLFVGAIYMNAYSSCNGDKSVAFTAFNEYFTNPATQNDFIYLMVETVILMGITYTFMINDDRDFIKEHKNIVLLFAIITVSIIADYFIGKYVNIYARPFALCALLSTFLIRRRNAAIFLSLITCVLVFIMDTFTNITFPSEKAIYSSLILGLTCGILAIYILGGVYQRIKVLAFGLLISVPTLVCVSILEIIPNAELWLTYLLCGVASGLFSSIFVLILMPLYEYFFNVVTDFRLAELTNSNAPLIHKLRINAQGTYQHSLVVASLAEPCAVAIGLNSVMARAAAYYHDMGKLKNPNYFTENQTGANPHDELTPELSADIIRSHPTDGYNFIKRNNLPGFLADVAKQHHGTLPIKYFYAKAKKYTDNEVDVRPYSYTGPKPQTKLAVLIMIADAVEAKTRSMSDRSPDKVDKAVREIIEERMELEQFSECDITLQEIEIIRQTIVDSIVGIYHDRIKYPKIRITRKDTVDTEKENG